MLEKNHTLIDLEFGFNNFALSDVSTIDPLIIQFRFVKFKTLLEEIKHFMMLKG